MPGILIASDKQYHETLRAFFAAGQPAQCCANAGEARRADVRRLLRDVGDQRTTPR